MDNIYRRPEIAAPTIVLAAIVLVGHALTWTLALKGHMVLALITGSIVAYTSFTPLHDATHRAVGRAPWLSGVVGRLMAPLLFGSFPAFRFVHLSHHKHTNDGAHDPDHYSARGNKLLLPLRWATQDLYYYAFIGRHWSTRTKAERVELVGMLVVQLAILATLVVSGHGWAALVAWVIPSRVAIVALAFAFDYLPHIPHDIPARVDRERATRNIPSFALQLVFLNQNLHKVHHHFPGVPFYAYARIYRHERGKT